MSLFTSSKIKNRASEELKKSGFGNLYSAEFKSQKITGMLYESLGSQRNQPETKIYDIFLSHSSKDASEVEGLKLTLEDMGYSVYVDWIDDPQLDRSKVTKETAILLQQRMKQSKSLIYAFSENGLHSKWMPWELGFFDGLKGKATILPIVNESSGDRYVGSEFLGVYNYVVETLGILFVHASASRYIVYNNWLQGSKP